MSILNQLSSQVGDRTEYSNRKVVLQCLEDPDLLAEIAEGLKDRDAALIGDCAEVLTKVAEGHPEWVVPYAEALVPLVNHKNTRVRWEAMHALALITAYTPTTINALLPKLEEILRTDKSVIVRDYATDALANYAGTVKSAAEASYPLLREALTVWSGKQAGHALKGLANVAVMLPMKRTELHVIAEEYSHSDKEVVRKKAKELLKVIESQSRSAG
jgi:HEAT repeat protein